MARDLVIGVDASTTAVKAIVFDRAGKALAEFREAYPWNNPKPGFFEQDPEDWWRALVKAVAAARDAAGAERIAALCIGIQRETFVLLDGNGKALHPAILWIDERAKAQVARLTAQLGRERIREISGKPPDPTPALYGIAWLQDHVPDVLRNAAVLFDVHGYLVHRLTGRRVTSVAAADPLGLVDLRTGTWDATLTAAVGLRASQLPELVAPGVAIGESDLVPGALIVSGAGDGQMSGLGVGAVSPELAYLSLGSGVVTGMFSDQYRTSDAYRTLASPTGHGYIHETVLKSGMQLVDWVVRSSGRDLATLAGEAEAVAPGADGLLLLPYFAGVMNPWWDPSARGAILGLTLSHTPAHIFRAALEGIALEQAVATAALEDSAGRRAERFIACGGGTKSRQLMAIMAAALERPLAVSPVAEAVALGAAILAAAAAGLHGSVSAAAAAMVAKPEVVIAPEPALATFYRARLGVYRDMFTSVRGLLQRL